MTEQVVDVQYAARIVATAKVLADAAKVAASGARQQLADHMRDTGTERVRVTADDGRDLGAVSLARGRLTPRVADEAAFTAWVAERYPTEVVQVVRPTFRDRLLAEAATLQDPVDRQTGEVIPGVELVRGEPYLTVRATAEARDRMRDVLARAGLLELETGDAPA